MADRPEVNPGRVHLEQAEVVREGLHVDFRPIPVDQVVQFGTAASGDDVEGLLKLIDQTLAQFAIEKMRLASLESGRSKLSDKEIEEEIRKARREL